MRSNMPRLQLLDMLKFYTGFEINDQTGNALTQKEMTTIHYEKITSLQVYAVHNQSFTHLAHLWCAGRTS